jgi:hypothetical protein
MATSVATIDSCLPECAGELLPSQAATILEVQLARSDDGGGLHHLRIVHCTANFPVSIQTQDPFQPS